jgi:methyl-accepting chemotaxis protein
MKMNKQWFLDLPIRKKLWLPLVIFLIFTIFFVCIVKAQMDVLSTLRAYVGGEGLWSKAQKDATYYLRKYVISGNENDYNKFLMSIKKPLGAIEIRTELEKPRPDFNIVYQRFADFGIHPDDTDGMIMVFGKLRFISYVDNAIKQWKEGGFLITELAKLGDDLHKTISSGDISNEEKNRFLIRIDENGEKQTGFEDTFSASLGEASRWTKSFFVKVMVTVAILGIIIIILAMRYIAGLITKPTEKMAGTAELLAIGDINQDIEYHSGDEIGRLAESFRKMIKGLKAKTEVISQIADGNMAVDIQISYEKDTLGKAMIIMKKNIGALITEIDTMVESMAAGRLDARSDASKYSGDFGKIIEGINNVLNTLIEPVNVIGIFLDRISKGDVSKKITIVDESTNIFKGDFKKIMNSVNRLVDELNSTLADAGMVIDAAKDGRLDTRADSAKHGGDFGRLVQGVNDTLEAVSAPLKVAARYMDRISKGDIPEQITDDYKGDFKELQNSINRMTDALRALIHEDGGAALEAAASRDLTITMKREYEGAFAKMKDNINKIASMHEAFAQVAAAADQVGSASGQIASSSQQLAEGASEQAASLEETSASLEEMASMVKQNADNANQANKLMQESGQVVKRATQFMGDLTGAMAEISDASEETQKIIKTIDEIAFQTNLLALNAAVEAARAGEAGAGFAVVANEVGNLAMRSADAAKNTAALIEDTIKKVAGGSSLVEKTGGEFKEVAESSGKVGILISEIDVASNEQSKAIEEINKAVAEMDKVTQQNAANAEETASASEEMSAQTQELNGMLASFKLSDRGAVRKQITAAAPVRQSKNIVPAGGARSAGLATARQIQREVRPDEIIPMEEEDFKDF